MRHPHRLACLGALLLVITSTGCNTLNIEVTGTGRAGETVHDRKAYFLWGLTPTLAVNVREHCPHGVRSIQEETTFGDGLLRLITLGIYSPRTTWYKCLEEASP